MRGLIHRYPRLVVVCLLAVLIASSAHADTTVTFSDPETWWAWLMGRISIPGG